MPDILFAINFLVKHVDQRRIMFAHVLKDIAIKNCINAYYIYVTLGGVTSP